MSARPIAVVIGGSESQASLLEAFRARGCDTVVVDGGATAPLLERCDHPIVCNFLDPKAVAAAIRLAGLAPNAIATMGSDAAVVPTADLCAIFGVPGLSPAAARTVCDKELSRAAFQSAGVPSTAGVEVAALDGLRDAYLNFGPHAVIKPVDGSGQRGVVEVSSERDLPSALEEALQHSRTGRVVIERYLRGQELTVSGFCVDGTYHPVAITDRILFPAPPLGVARAHRYPPQLDDAGSRAVFAVAEQATHAVGVTDGPSYVQVRKDGDMIVTIEIGARLGGGKDAELAHLVTGINQIDAVAAQALGEAPAAFDAPASDSIHPCAQVWFTERPPGRIEHLDAAQTLTMPGVLDAGFYYRAGMDYPPFENGAGRLGYLIVVADSLAQLDQRTAAADSALNTGIVALHAVT